MTTFNTMQLIKRRFFAMRNGALADNLRRAGAPYRIIFGLNLPQIVEIAADFTPDADLATALWNNTTTRESMLLAPMLFPRDQMTPDTAFLWVRTAATPETVDILCHRLLRHMQWVSQLIDRLAVSDDDLMRYAAIRLSFNILYNAGTDIERIRQLALEESQRDCTLTSGVCRMLLDEIAFLNETEE